MWHFFFATLPSYNRPTPTSLVWVSESSQASSSCSLSTPWTGDIATTFLLRKQFISLSKGFLNSADARSKYHILLVRCIYSCHSIFLMLRIAPLVYGYDQFYIGQYYSMVVVKKISARRVGVTVNVWFFCNHISTEVDPSKTLICHSLGQNISKTWHTFIHFKHTIFGQMYISGY